MDITPGSLTVAVLGILALLFHPTFCQDQLTVLPGDVTFGGLLDVNELENGACGKFSPQSSQEVVAVTWFLQSLNNRNYIPGVKIGFDVFRTCAITERSVDGALKLVTDYRVGAAVSPPKILFGLLGPDGTESAMYTSRCLSSLPHNKRLLQVSGSATGMELSNNALYPNFFRVIPSDSTQVKVLEQLLVQLGWNYIAIAYDDDNYGRSRAEELRRLAKNRNICVPVYQTNLQSTTGRIVPITRGALVTSPPYFSLPEFQSFWNDLWTNQTLFTDYARRIPWLAGLFQQVAQCDFTQSDCWDRRRQDVYSVEKTVSLYTGYHLKAAAVLAAFLKQQHTARCSGSNTSLCQDLIKLISDRTSLLQTLNDSVILLSEFRNEISEFANVTVTFDENGDINYRDKNYAVYNVQEDNRDLIFKQVATYADDKLTISESDTVFYTEAGSPLTWAQRPLAQCDVNHDCLQCVNDVANDVVFMEGYFYIVGILPIHEKSTQSALKCHRIKTITGADLAESLIFAVKQINKKEGMFKDILPNRRIGLLLINSCSSPLLVRQRLLDLHSGRLVLPDNSNRNSSFLLANIMGYVGAFFSGDSMAAADTLNDVGRPFVQVSAGSTSPYLSDRIKYPYFMRLVPSDNVQAQILLDLAVKLNSNYIQIIYDQTTEYAKGLVQKVEETLAQNYANVCIAQKIPITPRREVSEYKWIKDELRKKSSAKLVIVVLYDVDIAKVMDAILPDLTPDDNFLFLGTDSWGRHQNLIEGKIKLEGSLVLTQEVSNDLSFASYFKSVNLTQTENIWLRYFLEARKNCYFDKSFERKGKTGLCPADVAADYVQDPIASLHIQAVNALVLGFNATLNQLCGPVTNQLCSALTSEELVKALKKIRLDLYNKGERAEVFDDNGDGLVGFTVLQVTRDRTSVVDAVEYREVGSWTHQTLILDERKLTPPGGEKFSSVCPNQLECSACFKRTEQTQSMAASTNDDNTNTPVILGVSLAFVAIVIVLLVFVIYLWRRLKLKGREGRTIRYMTGVGGCGISTQLSTSSGSGHNSVRQSHLNTTIISETQKLEDILMFQVLLLETSLPLAVRRTSRLQSAKFRLRKEVRDTLLLITKVFLCQNRIFFFRLITHFFI
ncbi:LOW QUALITY PROTEIN: uncharacterized protein LOC112559628 [Pomacea canaliculata]|uniref:LOW QUALITY PROTEIN: uncharacterized protein LOC112559628 n=1 Tax=Pomacea canaliculata TaxID=400727 RepID=UPI000D726C0A|nr:LOW QUALITY PROTEIN: uncharacterized protein LOC112559628 [Pomacea canaliculata]